ncbi:MAG: D-alanyl-D-alanine carboxypeptidase/D-alanyl-D-alanine endopeptidase [Methanomicrobiales archaeon]
MDKEYSLVSILLISLIIVVAIFGNITVAQDVTDNNTSSNITNNSSFNQSNVSAEINSTINSSQYVNSNWGILFEDEDTGEIIYQANSNEMYVPGSTAKLFITSAALNSFGPDYRFETPVYYRGDIDDSGTLKGDLILVASGDPTMGGRDTPDGRINFTNLDHGDANSVEGVTLTAENPLTGLNQLARQVKDSGIKKVDGNVIIDDRLFETTLAPTGEYMISPVMINDNMIDLEVIPGEVGGNATVNWRPQTSIYNVTSQVTTVASGTTNITVNYHGSGKIILKGQIPANSTPVIRTYTVKDPSNFARSLFIEALQREGVEVTASPKSVNSISSLNNTTSYNQENQVALLTSLPFSENIKLILKVSQNQQADTLVSLLASRNGDKSFDDGMLLLGTFLDSAGVNQDAITLKDGRGGSPADRVSPQASNQLLRFMSQQTYFQSFYDALPIMGFDGTLYNVVNNSSPLYGKVHAKTGTALTEDKLYNRGMILSKSLAGYITTKSGKTFIFSIYVNNLPIDDEAAVGEVDRDLAAILETIYNNY